MNRIFKILLHFPYIQNGNLNFISSRNFMIRIQTRLRLWSYSLCRWNRAPQIVEHGIQSTPWPHSAVVVHSTSCNKWTICGTLSNLKLIFSRATALPRCVRERWSCVRMWTLWSEALGVGNFSWRALFEAFFHWRWTKGGDCEIDVGFTYQWEMLGPMIANIFEIQIPCRKNVKGRAWMRNGK